MGKLIPFLFIALDGKSAVAHLRLRIPGHKLRGSWFSFRWSPVRIVIGSHGLIATVFYFKNYATGIQYFTYRDHHDYRRCTDYYSTVIRKPPMYTRPYLPP